MHRKEEGERGAGSGPAKGGIPVFAHQGTGVQGQQQDPALATLQILGCGRGAGYLQRRCKDQVGAGCSSCFLAAPGAQRCPGMSVRAALSAAGPFALGGASTGCEAEGCLLPWARTRAKQSEALQARAAAAPRWDPRSWFCIAPSIAGRAGLAADRRVPDATQGFPVP